MGRKMENQGKESQMKGRSYETEKRGKLSGNYLLIYMETIFKNTENCKILGKNIKKKQIK